MFKTKTEQVRIVTEAFTCPGIVGRAGEDWVIDQAYRRRRRSQNSKQYDGPIPHGAKRYEKLDTRRIPGTTPRAQNRKGPSGGPKPT